MGSDACELRAKLPSTMEAIENFCQEFRAWHRVNCHGLGAFGAELMIREALTNSVVHAHRNDPDKYVCCILRVKKRRFLIFVQDEGAGFDWRTVWNRSLDLAEDRGRGIHILRRYSNRVRFNLQGNAVSLVKRF